MYKVFISYSREDHHFAELLQIKLKENGITVWLDNGSLRAGNDWRQEIDKGISECSIVLVAISTTSSSSAYVTYEWASAMGHGKAVLPLKLSSCDMHPKLEPIQYLDFSVPGNSPWEELIKRIKEIESDYELPDNAIPLQQVNDTDQNADSILEYLNQRGYQMVSFERLIEKNVCNLDNTGFIKLIKNNSHIFRKAKLKGNKAGIAKL